MIKASCYNCNKRTQNCHSNCEDYLLYKEQLAQLKKQKEDFYLKFPYLKPRKRYI